MLSRAISAGRQTHLLNLLIPLSGGFQVGYHIIISNVALSWEHCLSRSAASCPSRFLPFGVLSPFYLVIRGVSHSKTDLWAGSLAVGTSNIFRATHAESTKKAKDLL